MGGAVTSGRSNVQLVPSRASTKSNKRSEEDGGDDAVLSVSQTSNVKTVAGKIAHISRASEPPALHSVGAFSTNQAVKAIAVARDYVIEDKIDFLVEPSRVPDDQIKNLIELKLEKKALREPADVKYEELKCAATTEVVHLAGAIANHTRDGHRVRITAIGAGSVYRTIDSIIKARSYLEADAVDIRFQPSFSVVKAEGGDDINAIAFILFTQQI